MRRFSMVLIAATALVAGVGCTTGSLTSGPDATAQPCEAVYSAARCEAVLTAAAERLGLADDAVTAIEIAPDPTPRRDGILETRSGSGGIGIIAQLERGQRETRICVGVSMEPACTDDPRLTIRSPIGGGYADVTCAGEPPDGCATPVPRPDANARAAARPLRIERVVVPVEAIGRQEFRLGTALLPNGIWTVARAELVDPWPDRVRISSNGIRIELRSLVPGRPAFQNIHDHGWYPGTEEVEVLLVFEARQVEPGAAIEIRDLVVG